MLRGRMIAIMKLRSGTLSPLRCAALHCTTLDTDLCRRYRTMEAAANRLQKEAKGYLDSLRGTLLSASG